MSQSDVFKKGPCVNKKKKKRKKKKKKKEGKSLQKQLHKKNICQISEVKLANFYRSVYSDKDGQQR